MSDLLDRERLRKERNRHTDGNYFAREASRSIYGTLARAWRTGIRSGRPRPWLGMIAMPLVMVVASLAGVWWAWLPLTVGAWWWAPRTTRWSWLVAVQSGVVGADWAFLGASSLVAFPNQRWLVGGLWLGAALLIAIIADDRDHPADRG